MYVDTLGERPGTDEEAEASAAASRRAAAEWYQKYQADCKNIRILEHLTREPMGLYEEYILLRNRMKELPKLLKIRPSWTSVRACGLKPGCSRTCARATPHRGIGSNDKRTIARSVQRRTGKASYKAGVSTYLQTSDSECRVSSSEVRTQQKHLAVGRAMINAGAIA
jgi:hypothetical protein